MTKLPDINPKLERALRVAMETHGVSREEAVKALQWIITPTIRPIVGVEEFIESPHYLNARDADGRSAVYPKLMAEIIELNTPGKYSEAVLTGSIGSGKALDLGTRVPTPSGWTTMGALKDGDWVYAESGKPCRVVKAHAVRLNRPCYEVEFSDGTVVVADAEHLWQTSSMSQRANRKKIKTLSSVVTTQHIYETQRMGKGQVNHSIPVALPIAGEAIDFHCDPYALGVWLGDGSSDSSNIWCNDPEIIKEISRWHLIEQTGLSYTSIKYHIRGFTPVLRHWNLLNNKHIPEPFFRASYAQRLALLQGLMDSDGTVSKTQGVCSFSQKGGAFCKQVQHLLHSLGFQTKLRKKSVGYRDAAGNRVDCGEGYEVSFNCGQDFQPFRLPRKQDYVGIRDQGNRLLPSKQRYIREVRPVESRPVRCITVDSPSHLYLITDAFIPTHNTTAALYTTAYQLYVLSCYQSPHSLYGLDPASEIVFIFQSLTASAARTVDYERFRAMIEAAPYFQNYFKFRKDIESQLEFPHRIIVKPVSGSETAAIGQNVFGGIIDEINFMAVVRGSKSSIDGGTYDQAVALYNSISKRRKSRFGSVGTMPGMLCLVSSRRYPGQFTDKKEEEAASEIARKGKTNIYLFSKRAWDIKPDGSFMSEKFPIFIGDEARKPRILEPEEVAGIPEVDQHLVDWIPEDFHDDFKRDIMSSLRDVAGVATLAKHPFIVDREGIGRCQRKDWTPFQREMVDFRDTKLSMIANQFYKPQLPRFFHCDLAITGDHAGFAMGTVVGFKSISSIEGAPEFLPIIHIDALLEIAPPKGGEILLYKVRDVIHAVRKLGVNVMWGTFDQFQCVAGNTSVWTDHGLVDARHVEEGMVVQSRIGPRPVTKKWSFGVQDTILMTTSDHGVLEMTPPHKIEVAVGWHWPTINGKQFKRPIWGWKRAIDLVVGDVLHAWDKPTEVDSSTLLPLPSMTISEVANPYSVPRHLTPELAQWLGVVWGDGHIREDGIDVTCAYGEEQCAVQVFKKAFACSPSVRQRENYSVVSLSSRGITRWLTDCKLIKGDFIPEVIRHSPIRVQAAFIRGLFSTDGSVSKTDGAVSFSTCHWEWAEYVHVFLRSAFGISSCIVKSERKGDHYPTMKEVQYMVVVRGARARFYEAVGFCYVTKQQALENHLHVQGRDLWVKVESLEPSQAEVFDFEVAEDHAYIANGLVSHNSRDSMQLLKQAGIAVGYQSVDATTAPYDFLKNSIVDERVSMPVHATCKRELVSLERDVIRRKIDHPPNGCLIAKTPVLCSTGIARTFEELVCDYEKGITHLGVSFDRQTGAVLNLPLQHPRITKYVTELVEVEMENGEVFTCTPDHPYLLESGEYMAAESLKEGYDLRG